MLKSKKKPSSTVLEPAAPSIFSWTRFIVDGRNPANQLRLVVYPIIYKALYIPGG